MVMVEAISQAVEVVMVVVIGLWGRMSALSVAAQDIGLVIALLLVVVVEEVAAEVVASSPPAPDLVVVAVGTAMQTVSVMWTIGMMQGVLVIETAMTAEIASMRAAVAMLTTGTHRVEEIGLEVIGMELQIVIHHHHKVAVMAGRETMIGMSAQGGAVTDMAAAAAVVEVEVQHVMKEETTGTELVRMSVLEGEEAGHLPLTIENLAYYLLIADC